MELEEVLDKALNPVAVIPHGHFIDIFALAEDTRVVQLVHMLQNRVLVPSSFRVEDNVGIKVDFNLAFPRPYFSASLHHLDALDEPRVDVNVHAFLDVFRAFLHLIRPPPYPAGVAFLRILGVLLEIELLTKIKRVPLQVGLVPQNVQKRAVEILEVKDANIFHSCFEGIDADGHGFLKGCWV